MVYCLGDRVSFLTRGGTRVTRLDCLSQGNERAACRSAALLHAFLGRRMASVVQFRERFDLIAAGRMAGFQRPGPVFDVMGNDMEVSPVDG